MKLKCNKCNRFLTQDLFLSNKNKFWVNDDRSYGQPDNIIAKKGAFIFTEQNHLKNKVYSVSAYSVLQHLIPEYEKGHGCCHISWFSHLSEIKCVCGNALGEAYLDCYEPHCVDFYEGSVKRWYKK